MSHFNFSIFLQIFNLNFRAKSDVNCYDSTQITIYLQKQ